MSNFVVSARKYRPVKFDDVVGQSHVTDTLKNALRSDHLAHAFLFCGPRGVGKTTCARILAKVINCQSPTEAMEPCNSCSSCQAFNENASFNITELDAASNNSVEHIRALIEQVRFQPQQGRYKVFIIDEVHMLSQQAFNAFLKTLEEPPPYAIFILATTEKHKIIPTILSRCQIFDFRRIQVPAIAAHLRTICDQEGIEAAPEALHVIAQKADGALRDALSIFDRIVSFSGKRIEYQDVITNLNVLDYDYYFRLVDALLVEDLPSVILLFDEVLGKGFDGDLFINGLSQHLRDLLLCKDAGTVELLELSEGLRDRYLIQAAKSPAGFLLTALNLANQCDIHYKAAQNQRLHVEITLMKMAHINRVLSGDALEKKKHDLKAPETTQPLTPPTASTAQSASPAETPAPPAIPADNAPTPPPAAPPQVPKQEPQSLPAEPPKTPETADSSHIEMPRLGDLQSIIRSVKSDAGQEDRSPALPFEPEEVASIWNEHLGSIEQMTVQKLLQNIEWTLEEGKVVASVVSKLAENSLREQSDLVQKFRQAFNLPELMLEVIVDKSKIKPSDKPAKPLTSRQKLRHMYESNPNIKDLAERFGLRPDDH